MPPKQRDFLTPAIAGYHPFMKLAQQYADEVMMQTRRERDNIFPKTTQTTGQPRRTSAKKRKT